MGTETRESFFSQYTVYIVQIDDHGKVSTTYPRFKDLLKAQDTVMERGLKLDPPLLAKEFTKFKTKTIEKRKLTIQEFLERVFNDCPVADLKEVEEILGLSNVASTVLQRISSEIEEITVLLPNLQKVKVLIPIHESKIRDLKHLISEQMGMESSNQF